ELMAPAGAAVDSTTQASGKSGATLAAEAATIAGRAEDLGTLQLAADHATRTFDASPSAAELSALLSHAFHRGGADKSASAQPVAMLDVAAPVESPDFPRAL